MKVDWLNSLSGLHISARGKTQNEKLFARPRSRIGKLGPLFYSLFLLFISTHGLLGQTQKFYSGGYYIEQFTADDGLPGTSVKDIIQDRNGWLWMATHGGLVRYDGYEFTVFKPDPNYERGSYGNFVYSLYQDSSGLIWAGTLNQGLYTFDPEKASFKAYRFDVTDSNTVCSNWIYDLDRLSPSVLAISTQDGTSFLTQENGEEQFEHFFARKGPVDSVRHEVSRQNYILSSDAGVSFWSEQHQKLWFYSVDGLDECQWIAGELVIKNLDLSPRIHQFTAMAAARNGEIWVAGKKRAADGQLENVIALWNPSTGNWRPIKQNIAADVKVGSLYEDEFGQLWAGTWGRGLFLISQPLAADYSLASIKTIPLSPEDNAEKGNIWNIKADDFGNLWIGTWRGHLYKIHLSNDQVNYLSLQDPSQAGIQPGHILEDEEGNTWITTFSGVLYQTNATGTLQQWQIPFPNSARNIDSPVPMVATSDGQLWLGGYNGLFRFAPASGQFQFFENRQRRKDFSKDWVNAIVTDGEGRLYCGTTHGSIYQYDIASNTYEVLHGEYSNLGVVNDLLLSREGYLFASTSRGLHRIKLEGNQDKQELPINGGALDLVQTQDGQLWLSSYLGGLHRLGPEGAIEKTYRAAGDLQLDWINGIAEDQLGQLWLASTSGWIRLDPQKETFNKFAQLDRFAISKVASVNGTYASPQGRLWFAEAQGILSFVPSDIRANPVPPKVVMKQLQVNEQAIQLAENATRSTFATGEKKVALPHHQNNLTITYAGIHLDQPAVVRYQYRMEGLQEDWVEVGAERLARFPDLPPGTYQFWIKAANGDGLWSAEKALLQVQILHPWWQSWWAYALYLALSSSAIFGLYQMQLKRKLAQAESARLREVDQLKTRLYTNITHEFRTPLSVIKGMIEQAKLYFASRSESKFELAVQTVDRNAENLLRLVNQMLDLSKLEANALGLELIQADVVSYLDYIVQSFESYSESEAVSLILYKEIDSLMMDYDPDKLLTIVSNLLSNAIKFTPAGKKVIFNIRTAKVNETQYLLLKIQDEGIGIPAQQLPYIFDRFYQVDSSSTRVGEGTGIGLALTKELVELMQGHIQVQSEEAKGSTFTVQLPITRQAANMAVPIPSDTPYLPSTEERLLEEEGVSDTSVLPSLLIVEDNPDVLSFLQLCLAEQYELASASNGRIGLEKALEMVPDLIISDVMMPELDGYQLCKRLKKDERTSHIPIILLTAKADEQAKIKGLEMGADAYLAKPFNKRELFVRLRKMLELRQKLQERYQLLGYVLPNTNTHHKQEDEFIRKVNLLLESHLGEEDFGVLQLTHQLGLSRSQVFKKLKALTGKSIAQYIRQYRLHRAKQLLDSTELSISEVAFGVGFKDPAYFSRSFADLYGMAPSETRK